MRWINNRPVEILSARAGMLPERGPERSTRVGLIIIQKTLPPSVVHEAPSWD